MSESQITKSSEENTQSNPEEWIDRYGDYLYRYALSRLRNTHEAENLVQETFLAALSARDRFSGRSTERTWLVGILKHKMIDSFRKSTKESVVTDLQNNEGAINDFFDHTEHMKKRPSDWSADPQALAEKEEFWTVFRQCLEKLPESIRAAFTLRELEKMDSQEICQSLEITQSNLWVMLHRSRLQLRQCLELNWFEASQDS